VDPFKFTTIAHGNMSICNPVESSALDACLERLALEPGDRVIDIGCGKGEMLIRLAERFGVTGVGLDVNPEFLRLAKEEAERRAVGRVTFHLSDANSHEPPSGTFTAAICFGSTHALGDYKSAPGLLAKWVKPGGRLLIGEGYWRQKPDPEYLHLLGADGTEHGNHNDNIVAGVNAGLLPLFDRTSSVAEWDAYEDLYAQSVESYLDAKAQDPDTETMRQRIRTWRSGYLRWGRDTLGFGTYIFRKP